MTVPESLRLRPYHELFVGYLILIVALGTGFSIITGSHLNNLPLHPASNAAPFGHTQSGTPHLHLNYWANRKNAVNVIFVKNAWAWTTIAWALVLFLVKNKEQGSALKNGKQLADKHKPTSVTTSSSVWLSALRWGLATIYWAAFAAWFFGPPLAEHLLTVTGGKCIAGPGIDIIIDHQYCRSRSTITALSHPSLFAQLSGNHENELRPIWKGGHDISGHTFLMTLSALFLLEELAGFLPYLLPSQVASYFPRSMWAPSNPFRLGRTEKDHNKEGKGKLKLDWWAVGATAFALTIIGLWSWMLLMTALYFHTPLEKVSGLFVGLAAWLMLPKAT